jgi:transcriptional regulator with XRE-family HTH domain
MATRERPGDLGSQDARRLVGGVAGEFRKARVAGGWSQAFIASRAAMSEAQYGRLERDDLDGPTVDQLCRAARALGLSVSLACYPSGVRPRDAAQLRLLVRVEEMLGGRLTLRREVPLPIAGDLRAWDGSISADTGSAFVECESRLGDLQELSRRLGLKLRDDPRSGILILVVSNTAHNRRILAGHREALRALLPLDGASIIRHLRAGRLPPASGIILV